ncbi:hypothetical protein ROZALSC1DRAFT_26124, partial [Rozella allomycis CSF55]
LISDDEGKGELVSFGTGAVDVVAVVVVSTTCVFRADDGVPIDSVATTVEESLSLPSYDVSVDLSTAEAGELVIEGIIVGAASVSVELELINGLLALTAGILLVATSVAVAVVEMLLVVAFTERRRTKAVASCIYANLLRIMDAFLFANVKLIFNLSLWYTTLVSIFCRLG